MKYTLFKQIFLGMALIGALTAGAQKRPTIILIMADDLGWGDTGYNGNKVIKTPPLDQMAKEGIQFNRFLFRLCSMFSNEGKFSYKFHTEWEYLPPMQVSCALRKLLCLSY